MRIDAVPLYVNCSIANWRAGAGLWKDSGMATWLKRGAGAEVKAEMDRKVRDTVEALLADIEARGDTVEAVARDLDRQFPGIRFRMIDEQDRIRPHVKIFLNGIQVWELRERVEPSDELAIVQAFSGG